MKFYKIVSPNDHNDIIYREGVHKEGINLYPNRFERNPTSGGGIRFAREDILAFNYLKSLY